MQLGKASAYAVFATIFIAKHAEDGPVQGREIADAYGIPSEYLLKILQQLVRSQVLASERGRAGGFALRKSPGKTTLLEIVEAVEGPINGELIARREIKGANDAKQQVERVCKDIAKYTKSLLKATTIKQLAGNN